MTKRDLINVPNMLSVFRLLGTPLLFVLINFNDPIFFVIWFIILGFTDFLDGKLARAWNQVSEVGAHLDSTADVVYYLSTAWFLYTLFPQFLEPNLLYLQIFFVVFGFTILLSLFLFRSVLFLHTHLSRSSGVLIFLTFIASFYIDTTFLVFLTILMYTLSMIEFNLIYIIRGKVSANTRSLFTKL